MSNEEANARGGNRRGGQRPPADAQPALRGRGQGSPREGGPSQASAPRGGRGGGRGQGNVQEFNEFQMRGRGQGGGRGGNQQQTSEKKKLPFTFFTQHQQIYEAMFGNVEIAKLQPEINSLKPDWTRVQKVWELVTSLNPQYQASRFMAHKRVLDLGALSQVGLVAPVERQDAGVYPPAPRGGGPKSKSPAAVPAAKMGAAARLDQEQTAPEHSTYNANGVSVRLPALALDQLRKLFSEGLMCNATGFRVDVSARKVVFLFTRPSSGTGNLGSLELSEREAEWSSYSWMSTAQPVTAYDLTTFKEISGGWSMYATGDKTLPPIGFSLTSPTGVAAIIRRLCVDHDPRVIPILVATTDPNPAVGVGSCPMSAQEVARSLQTRVLPFTLMIYIAQVVAAGKSHDMLKTSASVSEEPRDADDFISKGWFSKPRGR